MKLRILTAALLLFGVVGCSKEEPKKPTGTASVSSAPAFNPSTTDVKKTTLTTPTTSASSTTVTTTETKPATTTETTPPAPTPSASAAPSTK